MSKNKQLASLKRNDDSLSDVAIKPSDVSRLENSKIMIRKICESLDNDFAKISKDGTNETVRLLADYFSKEQYFDKLLYSEISTFIFSEIANDDEARMANFETNVDELMRYYNTGVLNDNQPVANAVVKIYDHCALALKQKRLFAQDTYNRIEKLQTDLQDKQEELSDSLENATSEFNETIKNTLRDHITIFGVFSAIIITFVGGISYSASVLESMNVTSIFRLVFVICLLGLVLFNVIYLLFYVILKVSNLSIKKEFTMFHVKTTLHQFVNVVLLLIMFIDCLFYYIHAEKIRDYLTFLPWVK